MEKWGKLTGSKVTDARKAPQIMTKVDAICYFSGPDDDLLDIRRVM